MPVKPEVLADLKEPTPENEIKQKPTFKKVNGRSVPTGKTLSYVDARYVMDRLDQVVGTENWSTRYEDTPGGVRCYLSIWIWHDEPDAEGVITTVAREVTKADVGVPSTIEAVKGTHSDAFKRAAVHWGIARDLYEDREEEREAPSQARRTSSAPIRDEMGELDADDYAGDDHEPPTRAPAPRASNGRERGSQMRPQQRIVTAAEEKNGKDMKAYRAFMQGFNEEDSPWYCPDHGTVRVNEPWITDAGKAVGGSLKCTEPWSECQQQGPWISDLVKASR